jgi:serine/threonine protein kinase
MTESSDAAARGRVLAGRYRLDAKLGHGGMGVVHKGVDLTIERPVAVKLILEDKEVSEDDKKRFLREAKSAAGVQHEHIVEVFDLGRTAEGELFFVMELLDGESLSSLLKRHVMFPPARAVHIAAQIADALDAAHAAGIIHRDLKPANVMLIRRGREESFVKLIDFGVAKSSSTDAPITAPHGVLGTLGFMAPEQLSSKPIDGRVDVYALGALLYKMLTGSTVFEERSVARVVQDHLTKTPELPSKRSPTSAISSALDALVLKCLAKDPADRYTAHALGDALRALAQGDRGSIPGIEKTEKVAFASAAEPEPEPKLEPEHPALPELELGAPAPVVDDAHDANDAPGFELAAPVQRAPAPLVLSRQCAACGVENQKFARVCVGCGARLDTNEQAAHEVQLAEAEREVDAALGNVAPALAVLRPPPSSAPLIVAPKVGPLATTFGALPMSVWKRVLGYSALAFVLGEIFFFPLHTLTIAVFVILMIGGAIGVWARTKLDRHSPPHH